jgi:hypothetical protein
MADPPIPKGLANTSQEASGIQAGTCLKLTNERLTSANPMARPNIQLPIHTLDLNRGEFWLSEERYEY